MPSILIKNCGLKTQAAVSAATQNGANFLGFIHYPKSARYIAPSEAAALCKDVPEQIKKVAVVVNPSNEAIQEIIALNYADYLQLHGDESPERVKEIKQQCPLGIIKAHGIAHVSDIAHIQKFEPIADHLLLDTKSTEYGGTGTVFDWSLLQNTHFKNPWFLSGGLNVTNITQALHQTHAPMVDVSSGIEREKGVKDEQLISQFNALVQSHAS